MRLTIIDWQPSRSQYISRSSYVTLLEMLVRRATWRDRIVARFKPTHWLNAARIEVTNFVLTEHSASERQQKRARPTTPPRHD